MRLAQKEGAFPKNAEPLWLASVLKCNLCKGVISVSRHSIPLVLLCQETTTNFLACLQDQVSNYLIHYNLHLLCPSLAQVGR